MPIPDFQSLMLPLLKAASDGGVHAMKDVVLQLSDQFNLTEEERQQLQPSGLVRVIVNRVHWAKLHLLRAGVIEQVKRGTIRITQQGQKVLADPPARVDLKYLMRFQHLLSGGKLSRPRMTTPTKELCLPRLRKNASVKPTPNFETHWLKIYCSRSRSPRTSSSNVWLWICWSRWDMAGPLRTRARQLAGAATGALMG